MYGAKLFMRSKLNINKHKETFFLHFNAMQNGHVLKYKTYEFTQAFDKKISKQKNARS